MRHKDTSMDLLYQEMEEEYNGHNTAHPIQQGGGVATDIRSRSLSSPFQQQCWYSLKKKILCTY